MMATQKNSNAYNRIENIIIEKVVTLENENAQLKEELALVKAKLEVYERIANISDSKITLGFGPPIIREGGND